MPTVHAAGKTIVSAAYVTSSFLSPSIVEGAGTERTRGSRLRTEGSHLVLLSTAAFGGGSFNVKQPLRFMFFMVEQTD